MPVLYLLAGGLLVALGTFMGYRMGQGKPPLEVPSIISDTLDDMPGPISPREEARKHEVVK